MSSLLNKQKITAYYLKLKTGLWWTLCSVLLLFYV